MMCDCLGKHSIADVHVRLWDSVQMRFWCKNCNHFCDLPPQMRMAQETYA